MKVSKIKVKNYRILKDCCLDLEEKLSLIIGKNNTGKTSILKIMSKFLGKSSSRRFSVDDFSVLFRQELEEECKKSSTTLEGYNRLGIKLLLFIEYGEDDNLANVSKVMTDLDPDNNFVVLSFEYSIEHEKLEKLKNDYKSFEIQERDKAARTEKYEGKNFYDFLRDNHENYFQRGVYSVGYNVDKNEEDWSVAISIDKELEVQDIVNFKYIRAKREVTNKEANKTLSVQTSRIYERTDNNDDTDKVLTDFKDFLADVDNNLNQQYSSLFSDVLEKVKSFGGVKENESEIAVISRLDGQRLLIDNTTVVYKHDDENTLPEHYNGLGYMNLISIIFEIEILLKEFSKRGVQENPADINLLFIEEPEAHTHPQMQYVFIRNIKNILSDGIGGYPLQCVISTHSACIVADGDFDDIKYLLRKDSNNVIAKNLKDLKQRYGKDSKQYGFLRQYLTINRSEVFFADKVILIEGDTERILLPAFMNKIDNESDLSGDNAPLPLLSQNISIIEVGAYSNIFDFFIQFLGIKTLLLTDIDSASEEGKAVRVEEGTCTTNNSIKHFLDGVEWSEIKAAKQEMRIVEKEDAEILVAYQMEEEGYHARSFEDAFFSINKDFIRDNLNQFQGLKNRKLFADETKDPYALALKCVNKKTHFALDILFLSDANMGNWKIPAYIKEGLKWLQK